MYNDYSRKTSEFRDGWGQSHKKSESHENPAEKEKVSQARNGWGQLESKEKQENHSYALSFIEREYSLFKENQKAVEEKLCMAGRDYSSKKSRMDLFRKVTFFSLLFLFSSNLFSEQYTFGGKKRLGRS